MPLRRPVLVYALAAGAAPLAACALLVGDPDGHLQLGASDADGSNATGGEGGVEASTAETGVSDPDTGPDGGAEGEAAGPDAGFGGSLINLATGQPTPAGIVAASDALYWSNADGTIRRLPRDDGGVPSAGNAQPIVNVADSGAQAASDLLVDGNTLYALVGPAATASSTCRTYIELTLPTGTGSTCAKPTNVCSTTSLGTRVAYDATNVYLSNGDCKYVLYSPKPGTNSNGWKTFGSLTSAAVALASDNTNLYYAFDREIDAQLLSGALSPTPFAVSHTPIVDLLADDANVYWINGTEVEMLAKMSPGEPPTVLASAQPRPIRLAMDGTNLYWTNAGAVVGQGSVMMISKQGGAARQLAMNQMTPVALAVDGAAVYWANAGDGTIRALAR